MIRVAVLVGVLSIMASACAEQADTVREYANAEESPPVEHEYDAPGIDESNYAVLVDTAIQQFSSSLDPEGGPPGGGGTLVGLAGKPSVWSVCSSSSGGDRTGGTYTCRFTTFNGWQGACSWYYGAAGIGCSAWRI